MSRFLTPVLFAGGAAYVSWYNGQHSDRALILPGADLLAQDIAGQGAATVQILGGLAALFGVFAVVGYLRDRGSDPG